MYEKNENNKIEKIIINLLKISSDTKPDIIPKEKIG